MWSTRLESDPRVTLSGPALRAASSPSPCGRRVRVDRDGPGTRNLETQLSTSYHVGRKVPLTRQVAGYLVEGHLGLSGIYLEG